MSNTYEQLGGMAAIKAMVNEFYNVMESDPNAKDLRDAHPKVLNSARKNLYRFLTHWFGGPKLFSEQNMNSEWLELRHRHVNLNDGLVQQWIYCMENALSNLRYEEQVKADVLAELRNMINSMLAVRETLK